MTKRQPIIDELTGQLFTVIEVEPGQFQSVFPTRYADASCIHADEADGWAYIDSFAKSVAA